MILLVCLGSSAYSARSTPTTQTGGRRRKTYYIRPSLSDPFFAEETERIIRNNQIWKRKGFRLSRVGQAQEADFTIELAPRKRLNKYHREKEYYPDGREIRFSMTIDGRTIYIDETNWTKGVAESRLALAEYRRYVILHEVGHALGYNHVPCKKAVKCPVMYQMTRGPPKGHKGVEWAI